MASRRAAIYLLWVFLSFGEGKHFRFDYTYYSIVDGWLKLHVIPAAWHDAWLTCDLEGSVLASPMTLDMLSTMDIHWKLENRTQCAFYTGVHATFSKRHFFSIEGVPLSKMPVHWAIGEPDNVNNNEDCMVLIDGAVADVNCTELFPYMCFKKNTKDMIITSCGTVDKEYQLSSETGNCYKFHRQGRSWHAAYMTCADEGGYLTVINSKEEANYIKKLFNTNYPKIIHSDYKDQVFIGMHDWNDPGVWRTIHGTKLTDSGYSVWYKDQPNNASRGQHCGAMMKDAGLNDMWCDNLVAFVCEKSPDSLIDDNSG